MGNRLSVTLISSLSPDGIVAEPPKKSFEPAPIETPTPPPPIWEQPPVVETVVAAEPATEFAEFAQLNPEPEPEIEPASEIVAEAPVEEVAPPPQAPVAKKKLILPKEPKPEKRQAKQEVLQFEPVTRGRFEKSEPTIVEGQDLDVPTFLRKNVRVK
jgi:cell division protein FtsZ